MNKQMAQFAMSMLNSNPNAKNSPMGQQLMSILQSGNDADGEAMANNILNNYGLNKESAMNQIRSSGMFNGLF